MIAALALPGPVLAARLGRGKRKSMDPEREGFPFPLFRVSGKDYREIGLAVGRRFEKEIGEAHEARKEWMDTLISFAMADRKTRLDPFLAAIREETPFVLAELEGMAQGAGVDLERALAMFLNPELSAMMKAVTYDEECTTVAALAGGRFIVGHNEDGSGAYYRGMYVLDVTWPSGVRSVSLTYPGYLPGNGPSANSAGLVQTVNYIGAAGVRPGLPRYAIDRAALEARNIGEAAALATHPRRAYSQHHLFASRKEGKMVSVETSRDDFSIIQIDGTFAHANHFIHPKMKDIKQIEGYRDRSEPRQKAADAWAESAAPSVLTMDDVLRVLASAEDEEFPVCRPYVGPDKGCTLGAAIFDSSLDGVRLFAHEPSRGISMDAPWPGR